MFTIGLIEAATLTDSNVTAYDAYNAVEYAMAYFARKTSEGIAFGMDTATFQSTMVAAYTFDGNKEQSINAFALDGSYTIYIRKEAA